MYSPLTLTTLNNTPMAPVLLMHIILAAVTFGVLLLAGLQAVLVAIQQHWLRNIQHKGHEKYLRFFPPLETMERLLFHLISIGFILLSLLLISAMVVFNQVVWSDFIHKILLSMLAWVIFLILLIGRFYMGWRGKVAMRWTLCGVGLLMIVMLLSALPVGLT